MSGDKSCQAVRLLDGADEAPAPAAGLVRRCVDLPVRDDVLHIAADVAERPIRLAEIVPFLRRADDRLMEIYYQSVGRGCVLLLDATPDTTGLIPQSHLRRYEEFGQEIARRFGKSVAETRGEGDVVELDLGRPTLVNHALTMEDIREGQRVRAYRLEGFADGQWKPLVASGLSIGHKQIDTFPAVEVSRVRLVVTKSASKPLIRRLALFHVPPRDGQK